MARFYSRRQFIKNGIISSLALLLTACKEKISRIEEPTETIAATQNESTPSSTADVVKTNTEPQLTPTSAITYLSSVALYRQSNYEKNSLKKIIAAMLDDIGGIEDIVAKGPHVGFKLNLTGGTWWDTADKPPANEYFVTHPAVAEVLAELFFDAGAEKITMMDGLGDPLIFKNWGFEDVANRLGINLVNLCEVAPYPSFMTLNTGDDFLIYPQFSMHPIMGELNSLVSLAKLKAHATAGVTLSMKNLIGLVPINSYRISEDHNNRSAFHGNAGFDERLPKVIIDLNKVCPIDLGIIDGIATAQGGAGPWDRNISQIKPGILLAGKDPLALDTVGTMVMGFDPYSHDGQTPFTGGLNHLLLAKQAQLGCMDISKINVVGERIEEVMMPFVPAG
jgi:uncharacterized protein (DUF362 family)